MSTNAVRRYATHLDSDRIPPNEVWIAEDAGAEERTAIMAEARTRLAQAAADLDDDDQEAEDAAAEIVNAVLDLLTPKLAALVAREIERQQADRLDEMFAHWRDTEGKTLRDGIVTDLLEPLIERLEHIQSPRVTVEVPPANPTPVQLHMPANTKRRRRFTKDAGGEITGVEDVDD